MLYTVVGDPHAKPSNIDQISRLFDMVEGLGHPVIWLGDMLDTKEVVRSKCLNLWYKKFANSSLRHFVLVGNHDWHNLECTEHALEPLKSLENVHIVDKITFHENICFLPYFSDLKKFEEMVQLSAKQGTKILVMHQGVTGFDYGNGFIAENEVPLSTLKQIPLVISGHFHKFQEERNLIYLGTPFSHSFGESDQDKFIGTLDSRSGELSRMQTKFPTHITISVDCDKNQDVEMAVDGATPNFLRVILTGSKVAVEAFDKSKYPNVKFIERPDEETLQKSSVRETDSNEEKFQKWATDIKDLDSETITLGLEILKSV